MKVLCTGSRRWHDEGAVRARLAQFDPKKTHILVGDCLTGLDEIVRHLAVEMGFGISVYVAKWSEFGRAAGPLRNQSMVDESPDLALAWPLPDGRGTQDCLNRIRWNKIPYEMLGEE